MSRNTSTTGNTTPRLPGEKLLLINIMRYVVLDLQSNDEVKKDLALEWINDTEDYEFNFQNVLSNLADRSIPANELHRIKYRLISENFIPKWAKTNYGDKSNKVTATHRKPKIPRKGYHRRRKR